MGSKPGTKAQPLAVLELKGTGNPTRLRKRAAEEPELLVEFLPPPPHLDEMGVELWLEATKVLFDAKVITRGDYLTMYAYCESYASWRAALWHIRNEGMVFTDDKGVPRVSPYHKITMDVQDRMMRCAVELGLTPSARSRVKVVGEKDVPKEEDDWGQI